MVIKLEKILWNLFKETGELNYYLLYQRLRGNNEESNNRGNSIKRN